MQQGTLYHRVAPFHSVSAPPALSTTAPNSSMHPVKETVHAGLTIRQISVDERAEHFGQNALAAIVVTLLTYK